MVAGVRALLERLVVTPVKDILLLTEGRPHSD
jgi:hypothetical protein